MIVLIYTTIDGVNKKRRFATLEEAREFATFWMGDKCDIGSTYAVSFDGIATLRASGCTLAELLNK